MGGWARIKVGIVKIPLTLRIEYFLSSVMGERMGNFAARCFEADMRCAAGMWESCKVNNGRFILCLNI